MTVEEALERVSSSEFVLWSTWLEGQPNRFDVLHWYMASIVVELRTLFSRDGKRVPVEEGLLHFTTSEPQRTHPDKEVETVSLPEDIGIVEEGEVPTRVAVSKAAWFGAVGIKKPAKEE